MSASLVGSEMCIRDRSRPDLSGAPRRLALTAARVSSARARRPRGPRLKAVSYTHLTLPTICSV
eukprot:8598454-Alexandrium_andersonii.AAC.1